MVCQAGSASTALDAWRWPASTQLASGKFRLTQRSNPPASGRTLWIPFRLRMSATRALDASFGQVQ